MKKLLFNSILSFLLMSLTLAVLWIAPGTYPHDLSALVNKREMLKSKKSPRLIFIGGSSQILLKSHLIGKELNYSAVNMSLWGGLGTKEYLEEIKPYINAGDVVVVTMEYATALDRKFFQFIHSNEESKKFFFLMSPEKHTLEYLSNRDFGGLFTMMFDLSQIKARSYIRNLVTMNFKQMFDIGFPNYDNEFNENGDRITPFVVVRPLGDTGTKFNYPEAGNLTFLNDFADYASAKKVKTFFYFSHFPEKYYRANEKYINAYYETMKKILKFPILNKPSDFMYPEEYFADTVYHLNEKGEALRTAEVIKMIKKKL